MGEAKRRRDGMVPDLEWLRAHPGFLRIRLATQDELARWFGKWNLHIPILEGTPDRFICAAVGLDDGAVWSVKTFVDRRAGAQCPIDGVAVPRAAAKAESTI